MTLLDERVAKKTKNAVNLCDYWIAAFLFILSKVRNSVSDC